MSCIRRCSLIILLLWVRHFAAQSVSISPEINIKNDFAYYFFNHPSGHISLVRDKSFRLSIQTLDREFNWSSEKSIELNGKKWRVVDMYQNEENLSILYSTKTEETQHLMLAHYTTGGVLLGERILLDQSQMPLTRFVSATSSEHNTWICIRYENARNEKSILFYNRQKDSIYYKKSIQEIGEDEEDLRIKKILISESGIVYLHIKNENSDQKKNKKTEYVQSIDTEGRLSVKHYLNPNELKLFQTRIKHDPINDKLVMAGLYSEKNGKYPEGYYFAQVNFHSENNNTDLRKIPFSQELMKEWKGQVNHKGEWRDGELKLQDLVLTRNGGCLLFFENTKEISRRPYFSSIDPSTNFASRWFDYYFDDVLVVHFSPLGELNWERVLPKRQYSQDDDGIFSSFFIFSTSAFLRIIFNDAVNSDGTVSEYLLKPNGDHIRKSVLNTSYKNLNLRFRDALELDAQTIIIPSEDNGKLSLVRIRFDRNEN